MSPSIGSNIAPSAADTGQTAKSNDPLASESTFMTLLVSQLQNQDPLNPTDSTEFVSQLTAYSQLEQLMDINQNTDAGGNHYAVNQRRINHGHITRGKKHVISHRQCTFRA